MHRWNEHFMAQLGSNIVTFNATYVDMGGAPTHQAMCDYINSRNRRVLPQRVFVAAGMRARLIRNVSIPKSFGELNNGCYQAMVQ